MLAGGFSLSVQKRHVNDDDSTLTEQTKYQSPRKTNKKHKAFSPSSNPMSPLHGSHTVTMHQIVQVVKVPRVLPVQFPPSHQEREKNH